MEMSSSQAWNSLTRVDKVGTFHYNVIGGLSTMFSTFQGTILALFKKKEKCRRP